MTNGMWTAYICAQHLHTIQASHTLAVIITVTLTRRARSAFLTVIQMAHRELAIIFWLAGIGTRDLSTFQAAFTFTIVVAIALSRCARTAVLTII